jgi:Trk-type K+ transport system membrane component
MTKKIIIKNNGIQIVNRGTDKKDKKKLEIVKHMIKSFKRILWVYFLSFVYVFYCIGIFTQS